MTLLNYRNVGCSAIKMQHTKLGAAIIGSANIAPQMHQTIAWKKEAGIWSLASLDEGFSTTPPDIQDIQDSCQLKVPSGKLTWQWKTTILNRRYIFKWWISHCYVKLPECIFRFQKCSHTQKFAVKIHLWPPIHFWGEIFWWIFERPKKHIWWLNQPIWNILVKWDHIPK